jgi:uncharacterized delta-60 repeat protein/LPXTG-motif cell wall-anchored protein
MAAMAVAAAGTLSIAGLATGAMSKAAATDGTLDATFNPGQTGANGVIRSIAFTSDEKVYIGGDFTQYNGTAVGAIARLNADGSLDTTFNSGQAGFARNSRLSIQSISVAPDGDLYVSGDFTSYNGASYLQNNVLRLNSDGTVDNGFVPPRFENSYFAGQATYLQYVKMIGDRVFVSGLFDTLYPDPNSSSTEFAKGLVALTTSGAIESTFGANTQLADGLSTARAYEIIPVSGSTDFYVHGSFRSINFQGATNFGRVKNDGSRNLAYANDGSTNVGPNNQIRGVAVQPDGKIILGGAFTTFNGSTTAKGLVRVNPDATLDTTFTSPSVGLTVPSLALDSDGRLYIAGGIGTAFTSTAKTLARLKSDGTLDTTFDVSATPDNYDIKIALSPAGKLYVYGALTKFGETNVGYIARVNTSPVPSAVAPTTTTVAAPAANPGVVTPAGVPGLVTNVKATIKGTKAIVSWDPPTTGGAPTSYTAIASPVGPAGKSGSVEAMNTRGDLSCTVDAPATTCTITGLKEGSNYGFVVSASNASGGSGGAVLPTPVKVPVVKKAEKSLPETGTSSSVWLLLAGGLVLVSGGVILRRRQLS